MIIEYLESPPIIVEYISEETPYSIEVYEETINIVVSENTEVQTYALLAKKYRDEAEYYASIVSGGGIGTGERITGVHAGVYKEQSIDNDFIYFCVVGGDSSVAIWKKALLFNTN